MRDVPRFLLAALAVIGLCGAGELRAQELKFTNQCEQQLSSADRSLFEQAFALLDKYKYEVEDHINTSMSKAAGNPDSYVAISADKMQRWRGGVADMGRGAVKVACEYNATSNKCANSAGNLGWTFAADPFFVWTRDRVHICIDNVRSLSASGSPVALLAGTLAHELMHHDDGFEGHGPGGLTNPANPDTRAETIGVAMEHLIMTPDLQTTIKPIRSTFAGGTHNLVVDVAVENRNPQAGVGLVPLSGRDRNVSTRVRLQVDGVSLPSLVVAPLAGLASTVSSFQASIPAYDANSNADHELVATADSNGVIVEEDEANNTDSAAYSTEVDLRISAEVSGPPVCHRLETRTDVYPPGIYSWFEIPYRVAVKNRDDDTYAATTDVVMMYENMWTDSAMTSQEVVWLSSLAPSERREVEFTLDVPTDANCGAPVGATDVWFVADWNEASVFDADRGNNSIYFDVDAAYWRPDYVIGTVVRSGAVSYTVRNVGPTAVDPPPPAMFISRTQVLDPDGRSVFSAFVGDLDPGQETTHDVALEVEGCDPLTYVIQADSADGIEEPDEDNNDARVKVYPDIATRIACGEMVAGTMSADLASVPLWQW